MAWVRYTQSERRATLSERASTFTTWWGNRHRERGGSRQGQATILRGPARWNADFNSPAFSVQWYDTMGGCGPGDLSSETRDETKHVMPRRDRSGT
ncbi:hypothetical protein B0H12DRAFT_1155420 [Mycena haematopus]|nr:hypothetical protein B0H12DRAFT_1155420 [Mycena haematopus]